MGYWPSYNIPYSKELYKKAGYINLLKEKPQLSNSFDYSNCSRALIFKRDQSNIKSNKDFENMMRYNDYKNDNLSYDDPSLTIACRSDLVYEGCFGAIDVKYISVKEIKEGKRKVHIISGPTNLQQPTFSWKNTTCDKKSPEQWYHDGIVEIWNFPGIEYEMGRIKNTSKEEDNPSNPNNKPPSPSKEKENTLMIVIIAVSGGLIIIILIIVTIIIFIKNKKSYDELYKQVNKISFQDSEKNNGDEKEEDLVS